MYESFSFWLISCHNLPSILPNSPNVAVGFCALSSALFALQNEMYGVSALFGLSPLSALSALAAFGLPSVFA